MDAIRVPRPCLLYTSFQGVGVNIKAEGFGFAAQEYNPETVSYTHLDVYKRQATDRSEAQKMSEKL